MIAQTLVWTVIGFVSGSMMYSLWLGRLALGADIRQVGDGNPGMTNVFKAGGKWVGVLAFVLDVLKGAIPVALAKYGVGIDGAGLVVVSLAPIVGHAFSPFLKFNGGKAVAVSFGVWMALTFWEVPMLGGIALGLWYLAIRTSGWALMGACCCVFIYLLLFDANPVLLAVWIGNVAIFAWKYRADLRHQPELRGWLRRGR